MKSEARKLKKATALFLLDFIVKTGRARSRDLEFQLVKELVI